MLYKDFKKNNPWISSLFPLKKSLWSQVDIDTQTTWYDGRNCGIGAMDLTDKTNVVEFIVGPTRLAQQVWNKFKNKSPDKFIRW